MDVLYNSFPTDLMNLILSYSDPESDFRKRNYKKFRRQLERLKSIRIFSTITYNASFDNMYIPRRHINNQASKMLIKPSWTKVGDLKRKEMKDMIEDYYDLEPEHIQQAKAQSNYTHFNFNV